MTPYLIRAVEGKYNARTIGLPSFAARENNYALARAALIRAIGDHKVVTLPEEATLQVVTVRHRQYVAWVQQRDNNYARAGILGTSIDLGNAADDILEKLRQLALQKLPRLGTIQHHCCQLHPEECLAFLEM